MPALENAALAVAALFCVAAVAFDLRERRIPNNLNLLAFLTAVLFAALESKLSFEFVLFVAASFVFAYLLYKLGVWAGGDAKFFTALMCFFALLKADSPEFIVFIFLAAAALTLPVLLLLHWKKMVSFRGEFVSAAAGSLKPALAGAATSTAIYLLYALATGADASSPRLLQGFALSLAIFFAVSFFGKSFGVVSEKVLRQTIPVARLEEGEIPGQSVYIKEGAVCYWSPPSPKQLLWCALKFGANKALAEAFPPGREIVSCLRAAGLSKQEITKLKKAGVKQLVVKQSIPFAPALALGFWLAVWL